MPIAAQGASKNINADVRNGVGARQDPSLIALGIRDDLGNLLAGFPVYEPDILHDAIGLYHYPWSIPANLPLGTYRAEWGGALDGVNIFGYEDWEIVLPGSIVPGALNFLVGDSSFDSVRKLLGVEAIDLSNADMGMDPFAPHVERLLKNIYPAWGYADLETIEELRLATEYGTAAVIAESMAKGGFIGLVRPEGQGRDWDATAKIMWSYFDKYVTMVSDTSGGPSTLTFITDPADYSAVALLVGTEPNPKVALGPVTKELIELAPFGPAAERTLKSDVPDWYSSPAAVVGGGATNLALLAIPGSSNVRVDSVSDLTSGDWVRLGRDQWRQLVTVGTAGAGGTGLTFSPGLAKEVPLAATVVEVASDGSDRWDVLKLAAEYGTAFNILSAMGSDRATGMWAAYMGLVSELASDEEAFLSQYNLTMMKLAGPTRAGDRDEIWDLENPVPLDRYRLTVP